MHNAMRSSRDAVGVRVLQLDYPNMVEGLLLININPCAEGWINWAAHKVKPRLNASLFIHFCYLMDT